MLTRRLMLAGAAALAATPAAAQFSIPFGRGGVDVGTLLSGAKNLFDGFNLGEADEIKMGESFYGKFIDKSGGPYRSARAQGALKEFAQPVLATSKRPSLPWEIVLLDDDTVNAWALPGGKLAINKGLLRYTETPDELAAVIGHEVAHSELSHALSQMKSESFTKGLTTVGKEAISSQVGAARVLTGPLLDALEAPIFNMITSGYSQTHEYAADAHVLPVFAQTGHDPQKASKFFYTLLKLVPPQAEGASATNSLFSTHPGTKDRIARLEAAAKAEPRPLPGPANPGWQALKQSFPTRRYKRAA